MSTLPSDESQRQRALDDYHILDNLPEAAYDDIVKLASTLCGTPTALITLIDRDRQWFKARVGFDDAQTGRDVAVCDHAIRTPDRLMEVADLSRDPRFAGNPYVNGESGDARFYAGMPLVAPDGAAIGTVCVVDDTPRNLDPGQRAALESLARLTMALLDGRRRERTLAHEAFVSSAATPAPAEAAAPAGYTLALLELQDHAGTVARIGERATEKALQQLDEALERCLHDSPGDAINRASGNVEYVAVLHGDDAAAKLERLRDVAERQRREHGLHLLFGTARTDGAEPTHAVFLRADADLMAQKAAADAIAA